jgi:hypothetical protein
MTTNHVDPSRSQGTSPPRFRSVTHGTCALNGKHTSEEYAGECPALGRNPQERIAAFRAQKQATNTTIAGASIEASSAPDSSGTSNTIFRNGRAGRRGRPRVPLVEQAQKARDRARAYRARQRPEAA